MVSGKEYHVNDIFSDSKFQTKSNKVLGDLSDNEILKLLLSNQLDIKDTQTEMSKSMQRIFDLYQEHEKWLKDVQRKMDKRDTTNGHTVDDLESLEKVVDEFSKTRQQILDDITNLKSNKVDIKDFNKMDKTLTEIQITLEDHCKYEENETKNKQALITRQDGYKFAIIGLFGAILGALIFKFW